MLVLLLDVITHSYFVHESVAVSGESVFVTSYEMEAVPQSMIDKLLFFSSFMLVMTFTTTLTLIPLLLSLLLIVQRQFREEWRSLSLRERDTTAPVFQKEAGGSYAARLTECLFFLFLSSSCSKESALS